jgi:hypothetical protein
MFAGRSFQKYRQHQRNHAGQQIEGSLGGGHF